MRIGASAIQEPPRRFPRSSRPDAEPHPPNSGVSATNPQLIEGSPDASFAPRRDSPFHDFVRTSPCAPRRSAPPSPRRRTTPVRPDAELISVAGVVGSRVVDSAGKVVGRLDDLVVHWEPSEPHPRLAGVLVKSLRRGFVPHASIAELRPDGLRLHHTFEVRPVERKPVARRACARRPRQTDRRRRRRERRPRLRPCARASPRATSGSSARDVSARTLLRRLGPARLRRRVARERVYDWAHVAAFSVRGAADAGSVLNLTERRRAPPQAGPAGVDALLEDLPPHEQTALAKGLTTEPKA